VISFLNWVDSGIPPHIYNGDGVDLFDGAVAEFWDVIDIEAFGELILLFGHPGACAAVTGV
jgi:hypothetical protein